MIRRYPVLALFVAFTLLFSLYPRLDVWVAGLAWDAQANSFIRDVPWINALYSAFQGVLGYYLLFFAFVLLVPWVLMKHLLSTVSQGKDASVIDSLNQLFWVRWLRRHQKDFLFLLVILVFGAVLVEVIMKGFWGRPRPHQIQAFAGEHLFVPFLQVSDVCSRNCSFASGHAAIGFYFMAIAWPLRKKRWMIPGLLLGLALAYVRIAMGGHFFTDVMTSGFVVYATCWLFGRYWYGWQPNWVK